MTSQIKSKNAITQFPIIPSSICIFTSILLHNFPPGLFNIGHSVFLNKTVVGLHLPFQLPINILRKPRFQKFLPAHGKLHLVVLHLYMLLCKRLQCLHKKALRGIAGRPSVGALPLRHRALFLPGETDARDARHGCGLSEKRGLCDKGARGRDLQIDFQERRRALAIPWLHGSSPCVGCCS